MLVEVRVVITFGGLGIDKEGAQEPSGWLAMCYTPILVVHIPWVYTYVNIHCNVHLKWMHFATLP